jgi:hypothetical protein
VIADPPVDEGADQVTTAEVFPAVTDEILGAPGTEAGVTEADAADAALFPIAAFATTLKV